MIPQAILELRWVDIYLSQEMRESVALSMELMGLEQIKGSYVYQHFSEATEAVEDMAKTSWTQERKNQFALPFLKAQLDDDFRIIAFLENYFKATLIRGGYVIHELTGRSR